MKYILFYSWQYNEIIAFKRTHKKYKQIYSDCVRFIFEY